MARLASALVWFPIASSDFKALLPVDNNSPLNFHLGYPCQGTLWVIVEGKLTGCTVFQKDKETSGIATLNGHRFTGQLNHLNLRSRRRESRHSLSPPMVSKSLLLTSSKFHIRPIREKVGCGIVHFPSGNRFVLEAGNFSHKRC
jgi:hypothetical protein